MKNRLIFMKEDYCGQENLERYVTLMVGAFQFVIKRYIWQVGTKNQPNKRYVIIE